MNTTIQTRKNGPAHKTGAEITLYHGTTKEGAAAILREGFFSGRVYLTPRSDIAADYAPVVLAVEVDPKNLWMDFDTAELEEDDETIAEWLDRGESVYTRRSDVVEARRLTGRTD